MDDAAQTRQLSRGIELGGRRGALTVAWRLVCDMVGARSVADHGLRPDRRGKTDHCRRCEQQGKDKPRPNIARSTGHRGATGVLFEKTQHRDLSRSSLMQEIVANVAPMI
jgi:hypothetical protein